MTQPKLTPDEIKAMREHLPGNAQEDFDMCNEGLPRCLDALEASYQATDYYKADSEFIRKDWDRLNEIIKQKDTELQKLRLDYLTLETQCNEKDVDFERLNSRLQRSNKLIKKAEEMADHIAWKPLSHTEASYREALGEAEKLARAFLSDLKKFREGGE